MKIAAFFAATAYAGLSDMDEERKFTDKPAWMSADLGWENYFNRPANYRINELACRIDPFFQKFFPGNGMENQFEGVLRSIKRSFEKCHGELMTTPPDCKWMDWLDGDMETVSHRVMVVYGVAVREFIYKSDEKRACQSHGLRLLKRLDRLNIYMKWRYCRQSSEGDDCVFKQSFNTDYKRNTHPRSDEKDQFKIAQFQP